MNLKSRYSLNIALWLVVAIVILPVLFLLLSDYRTARLQALGQVTDDVRIVMNSVRHAETVAVREVELVLRVMAKANDMKNLDAGECSELAQRLVTSTPDTANMGAALPDGTLFCSALPLQSPINVKDRKWFQSALPEGAKGYGEFVIGRVSGLPSITFPLAMRQPDGSLDAVLFVASKQTWLDRLVQSFQLREGWSATLMTSSGLLISRYPGSPMTFPEKIDPAVLEHFKMALENKDSIQDMPGLDGVRRLYGVVPMSSTNGEVFVAIGAPVERSLAEIDASMFKRLVVLLLGAVAVLLFARIYIYRVIESAVEKLRTSVQGVTEGNFKIRVDELDYIREFAELGQGINAMAATIESRDAEMLRFSRAIEQSPESIVMTDLEAKIIYVNDAFTRVSGYSRDEVIGRNPNILQSGNTPPETYRNMWETLGQGRVWRGELRNKRKDGTIYDEEAAISQVVTPEGVVTHYVAVKQDITEQKRIAAELEVHRQHLEAMVDERTYELFLAKDAAEVANQAKSSFLANMSHEIRTPLNAILGLGHMLEHSPLAPDQADKLHKISTAGKHLLQVINDILDLAKIEAGRFELDSTEFNPVTLLNEAGGLIAGAAQRKNLTIHLEPGNLPARVVGDPTRLRQALLNLMSNAVKFTEQGSVTVRCKVESETSTDLVLFFVVEDTGPGIPLDRQGNLFTAFEQLDNSSTRQYGGTGLGLVITRHLAHLMGGEVGVISAAGEGARFWLKIRVHRSIVPLELNDGSLPTMSAETQLLNRSISARILVVEDNQINSEVAAEMLRNAGCKVDIAADGEQAVAMASQATYDLILMDLQMPRMNGFEATDQIRKIPAYQDTPILAFTANVLEKDRVLCFRHGMTEVIAKPVEAELLFGALLHWLPVVGSKPGADLARIQGNHIGKMALSPEALLTGAEQLSVYLATGSVEATELFMTLVYDLEQLYGKVLHPLKQAIMNFDYQAAQREISLLADLKSRLEAGQLADPG